MSGIDGFHAHVVSFGGDADPIIGTDEVLGMRTFVLRDSDGNRLQAFERCGEGCGAGV